MTLPAARTPRRPWHAAIGWLLALAGAALSVQAAPAPTSAKPLVTGVVSRVVDGDTLWLATDAAGAPPIVVRIEGIDAPERCQSGGAEATQALVELAAGKRVTLRGALVRDDHGRLIARVWRDDDVDLGDRLVRDGHAWSARFRHDRGPYVAQERMAQVLRRGVHASAGALMPRDFRRLHGPCETAATARPASSLPSAAGASATAPESAAPSGWRCDGRRYCAQMTSCAQARWFLAHCPGVQMDGNGDGVPCERQWCGSDTAAQPR